MGINRESMPMVVRETMSAIVEWRAEAITNLASYLRVSEDKAEAILMNSKLNQLRDIERAICTCGAAERVERYVKSIDFDHANEADDIALGVSYIFRALGDSRHAKVSSLFGSVAANCVRHRGTVFWI